MFDEYARITVIRSAYVGTSLFMLHGKHHALVVPIIG